MASRADAAASITPTIISVISDRGGVLVVHGAGSMVRRSLWGSVLTLRHCFANDRFERKSAINIFIHLSLSMTERPSTGWFVSGH